MFNFDETCNIQVVSPWSVVSHWCRNNLSWPLGSTTTGVVAKTEYQPKLKTKPYNKPYKGQWKDKHGPMIECLHCKTKHGEHEMCDQNPDRRNTWESTSNSWTVKTKGTYRTKEMLLLQILQTFIKTVCVNARNTWPTVHMNLTFIPPIAQIVKLCIQWPHKW